jgi:UDP-3-O-[3-hydroxymyristoyl] glucosamine N-acyltransferase
MTTEEIYALPVNGNGWRVLPSGNYVKLGKGVKLGDGVKLGNYVTLGDEVTLGDGVKLGNYVTLGNYVKLGDGVKLGDEVTLGKGVKLGDDVTLGNYVKLGNYVTLGDEVTLGDGVKLGNYVTLGDGVTLGIVCGSKHIAYVSAPGVISIGCQVHTFAHWTAHVLKIADEHGYTKAQALEYQRIVTFLIAEFEAGPASRFPQIVKPTQDSKV